MDSTARDRISREEVFALISSMSVPRERVRHWHPHELEPWPEKENPKRRGRPPRFARWLNGGGASVACH